MKAAALTAAFGARERMHWPAWLGFALVLHLPATPVWALFGKARAAPATRSAPLLSDIPIDVSDDPAPAKGEAPSEKPAEPHDTPSPRTEPVAEPVAAAVAPHAAPRHAPAGTADGNDRGPRDPSFPKDGFLVHVDVDKLEHAVLGPRSAAALGSLYGWQMLFMQSGVDPLRDIERVYFVGMELGRSSDMAVVIQHHIASERLGGALKSLTTFPGGEPRAYVLENPTGVRRFALPASDSLLVVGPETALRSARKIPSRPLRPLTGSRVLWAGSAVPARALPWFGLPESIKTAKATVELDGDAVLVDLELDDASSDQAVRDAAEIAARVGAAADCDVDGLGLPTFHGKLRLFESAEFRAEETRVVGRLRVTNEQAARLLDVFMTWMAWSATHPTPAPAPMASAATSATPTASAEPVDKSSSSDAAAVPARGSDAEPSRVAPVASVQHDGANDDAPPLRDENAKN